MRVNLPSLRERAVPATCATALAFSAGVFHVTLSVSSILLPIYHTIKFDSRLL